MFDIMTFSAEFFDFLDSPIWRAWPFNAGYGEHLLPAIARMVFVSCIFGGIVYFLRFLYGPKGIWRDEEMDREAEEMRQEEIAELDALYKQGEMDEYEYQIKRRRIENS